MDMASLTGLQNCQSVDEIQRAIEKLQAARDRLVKDQQTPSLQQQNNLLETATTEDTNCINNGIITKSAGDGIENGGEDEDEELIDISLLMVKEGDGDGDGDVSQWLIKSGGDSSINIEKLEQDKSYMDLGMLNVQNSLVNQIKGNITEQVAKMIKPSPRNCALNNVSFSVPTPKKLYNMSPPTPLRHRMSLDSNSSDSFVFETGLSVLASSPLTSKAADPEILDVFETGPGHNINFSNFVGTPPRNIDTRTYTRPKKSRMSLDGHLQTPGGFNTLTLRKNSPTMSLQRQQEPNKNNNLNETFVQEDVANSTFTKTDPADESCLLNATIIIEPTTLSPRSHQIARNDSYSISKQSPKNNSNDEKSQDLNSTFVCATADSSPSENAGDNNSHNLSMEELHVMARLQEQSLKDASPQRTLTRKETRVIMSFNNFDVNHRPSRTSSNDTYSLVSGQSNPDSPGSSASGLSSPLDAQSYENLQSEAFRRSMPDLAIARRSSASGPSFARTLSVAPPMNLLLKSKPYHTSDTRLTHPATVTRLSMLPTNGFGYNKNKRNQSPDRSSNSSIDAGSLTMTRSRGYTSAGTPGATGTNLKMGPRSISGPSMPHPRQPVIAKPVTRPQSFLPPPGFSQMGVGPGIRPQSRIPAPGIPRGRLNRPSTAGSQLSTNNKQQPDWRDGCY